MQLHGKKIAVLGCGRSGIAAARLALAKGAAEVCIFDTNTSATCNEPGVSLVAGATEEQARATGKDIGTGLFNLSGNGKALTMGENKGLVKFVFDKTTDEILGFHVIGPRATDLAAEVAAVMECEGTISEIGSTVHPHPTVSEVVMEAAHVCHGCCVNAPKARK